VRRHRARLGKQGPGVPRRSPIGEGGRGGPPRQLHGWTSRGRVAGATTPVAWVRKEVGAALRTGCRGGDGAGAALVGAVHHVTARPMLRLGAHRNNYHERMHLSATSFDGSISTCQFDNFTHWKTATIRGSILGR